MNMRLKHDLEIFIDKESKILILGSFPSVKSREANFYYSHPQNRFFKVLYSLFNEEYSTSINDRKTFLMKHHLALYDVIYECDISGSDDASIKNVVPIDIALVLSKYPNIRCIATTGSLAHKLFDKYLLDKVDVGKIKILNLPSTSPANAKMNVEKLVSYYKALVNI